MNNYIYYKILFDGLIKGENKCFHKYNRYLEGRSHKNYCFNKNTQLHSHIAYKSDGEKEIKNIKMDNDFCCKNENNFRNQKNKYTIKYPYFYLNDILFKEEAETFFQFFNKKYDNEDVDKKELYF